ECLAATPLPAAPLELPVARADVVGTGISQDVAVGIAFRDIEARLADHHRQLALVIDRIASQSARQHDRVSRILERTEILHEHDRMVGNRLLTFLGMLTIVEPDAKDVLRLDRSQRLASIRSLPGVAIGPEDVAFNPRSPAIFVLSSVMNHAG